MREIFRPVRLARQENPEAPIVRAEKTEALQQHALYLCFTLRPAIFNFLRSVTVGPGRAAYMGFCHYT